MITKSWLELAENRQPTVDHYLNFLIFRKHEYIFNRTMGKAQDVYHIRIDAAFVYKIFSDRTLVGFFCGANRLGYFKRGFGSGFFGVNLYAAKPLALA